MNFRNSVKWTALAKISGVIRDTTIVALFGLSGKTDAIFIGMTIAMYWQLVAYQGCLSFLVGKTHPEKLFCPSVSLSLYVGTIFLLAIYFIILFDWNLFNVSTWYLLHGPLAAFLGARVAARIIVGDSVALVRATTVQNIVVIGGVALAFFAGKQEIVLFAWGASLIMASLATERMQDVSHEKPTLSGFSNAIKLPGVWQSISIPMLAFSIVLVERFFYSTAEGTVAVVKILETLATSLVFISQVFFYNPYLSKLNGYLKDKNENVGKLMRNGLIQSIRRSLILSVPIYLLGLLFFVILLEILPERFQLPPDLIGQEWAFGLLYLLFLGVWLMREHLERFTLLKIGATSVFNSAVMVLIGTLLFNYLAIQQVPYSVLIISVVLSMLRCVYLALKSQLFALQHG